MKLTNKLRNAFASVSTSGSDSYFATKWEAIDRFNDALAPASLNGEQFVDYNGSEGRALHEVVHDGKVIGCALFTWYRMPSGRYEFVGYLA